MGFLIHGQQLLLAARQSSLNLHGPRILTSAAERRKGFWRRGMTVPAAVPCLSCGDLVVRGRTVLTMVPENVVVSPLASSESSSSAFLGAVADAPKSRHVFTLGTLEEFRWLCLFRFKIWWLIPRVGTKASDIPIETQMLLLEAKEDLSTEGDKVDPINSDNTFYILLLPVLDGPFRASIQGNSANELQFCLESGDPNLETMQASEALFLSSGNNPFDLLKDSIKMLSEHKRTFNHISNKKVPENLDWFGWCTWDAFYTDVNPRGISEGLQSLSEGGTPARFLIIDDGWQDSFNEFREGMEPLVEGTQFATRLVGIKENQKFKDIILDTTSKDLGEFIRIIKERHKLKFVYMWHALAGCWGGVHITSPAMKKYQPKLVYPVQSPGNVGNVRDIAMDSLEKYGVGLVHPEKIYEFYNDLHAYLSSCGVDGVKVDVQNVLETLGTGFGGRVALTARFQEALEESVSRNFVRDNLICCMCHNTETIYCSRKSVVARASEDFMPRKPELQTLHIATVSYNSLLLGEIFITDWDMFQSDHATGKFHGAARAIGGCGVYVSDKPGHHNFDILRRLVLPDGSVLRAKFAGRPTRDCLFEDPVMDGKSLLKIWNLNKFSGVLGVFNCQGMGNWPMKAQYTSVLNTAPIQGHVSPLNIEFLEQLAGENWSGDYAVYAYNSGALTKLQKRGTTDVLLHALQFEIYTVAPIKDYFDMKVQFAPLGLIDMYNSGGAIGDVRSAVSTIGCAIEIRTRGPGRFGAYSSMRPDHCSVDNSEVEFTYDHCSCMLTFYVPDASILCWFCSVHIAYPKF